MEQSTERRPSAILDKDNQSLVKFYVPRPIDRDWKTRLQRMGVKAELVNGKLHIVAPADWTHGDIDKNEMIECIGCPMRMLTAKEYYAVVYMSAPEIPLPNNLEVVIKGPF